MEYVTPRPDPMTNADARRSALAAAERLRTLSETERDMIRLANSPGFRRWLAQIHNIGGCAHPIYLAGRTTVHDRESGEILRHYDTANEPGGRLAVRCRNRRETRCQPCSYLHAGDTFQLVRAGLAGGKGTPGRVRGHPRLFVTLTAPSFGAVHRATTNGERCQPRRDGGDCEHGRRIGCGAAHGDGDALVGQPLCVDCYDYTGHVLWHAYAGRLWNRFCDMVRRNLATSAGIAQSKFAEHARLSFAKVAEYQQRGAVHFHSVIRLDGPSGPDAAPPAWGTGKLLDGVVREAAATVTVPVPYSAAFGERSVRWGRQVDVHAIRAFGGPSPVKDDAVAAYVAKYVGKSVSDAGGIDYRISSVGEIPRFSINSHLRALMGTCWRLGGLRELEPLRLRAWAHTLGYRGHVLTKSRAYSTTYAELRAARAEYHGVAGGEAVGGADTVTESGWRYVGSGHTPAEAELAAGIAEDLAVLREIRHDRTVKGGRREGRVQQAADTDSDR